MAKKGVVDDLALLGVDYEFEPEEVDEDFFPCPNEGTSGDSCKDNAPTSSKWRAKLATIPLKLAPMA